VQLSEYAAFDFNRAVDNLFAPAGLDIGSEAPEEIALSIAAEVAAALSGRRGGFLRESVANIHSTPRTASGDAA
jgi:xanthine dehydrogenase accessory factor